jgi:formate C-acetyltransferase
MAAETAIVGKATAIPGAAAQTTWTALDGEERPVSERILRLRRRLLKETPAVSIERARYYTEHWRSTEESGLAPGIRVALAMKHVFQNMRHQVDPDDRIAGAWTENPIGIPLDIERGLFNRVFAVECDRASMLWFQIKGQLKFLTFMIRRVGPLVLYQRIKQLKAFGAAMPSIGLDTIDRRKVNPYRIDPEDRRLLQRELLPYWEGRTIADLLPKALEEAGTYGGDLLSFTASLPPTNSRNETIISTAAAMGTWQGHLVLDHETPVRKGLLAMREDARAALAAVPPESKEHDFLRSLETALDGVIVFAERLAERVHQELERTTEPDRRAELERISEDCRVVPLQPARSFRQAVQSYWTVKTAVELAMPFNVHAPGRLDQLFGSYYEDDLAAGRITREEACELLEELFLKVMSHNMRPYSNYVGAFAQRFEGSEPVTLSGQTRTGSDATNALTYVMLDAADRSRAALNFVVRTHPGSPEALYDAVAAIHARGCSSVSIMNDTVAIEALQRRGFDEIDARDYAITGCVDMCAPGKTGGEAFSALLLCRVLDATLRNGDSQTLIGTVHEVGPRTGDPDGFTSFDQLVDAFIAQAEHAVEQIVKASRIRDALYAEHLPAPLISAFMQGCLERKWDVVHGGALYDLEGILFMNSIANVVDSLHVIRTLIFERKRYTFRQLLEAIDHNFVDYEELHREIRAVENRWGNGDPATDRLAREITDRLFAATYRHRTYKGGVVAPFVNSMTSHTYDGRISIATPDGRRAGTPLAASCNPYNVEKAGPTAVLRSVAALDFRHLLGCAVNIRVHPSAIGRTPETQRKWVGLIRTYFQLGGVQLQPSVVSTETLRAAQRDPDSYGDVIVKVGGYSAYFVDLGHEVQNELIARTEHGAG